MILKEFSKTDPSSYQIPGKHVSWIECALFCAARKACWGCIQFSNATFAWNAVSDCMQADTSKQLQIENTSQKLGKYAHNANVIVSYPKNRIIKVFKYES